MKVDDFVWHAIYKESLKGGAKDRVAKDYACMGLQRWKRSQFSKIDSLIKDHVKQAIKESKKG